MIARDLKKIGLLASVSSALYLSGILAILSPLPLILGYLRYGMRSAVGISIFSTFLIFSISYAIDPVAATHPLSVSLTLLMLGGLTYLGFVLGHGLRVHWSFSKLLLQPVVTLNVFIFGFFFIYYFAFHNGVSSIENDISTLTAALKERLVATSQSLGGENANLTALLKDLEGFSPETITGRILQTAPLVVFWIISFITWLLVHTGIYYQLIREWKKMGDQALQIPLQAGSQKIDLRKIPKNLRPWISLWRQTFYWRLPDKFILPWIVTGALALTPLGAVEAIKEPSLVLFKIFGTFYCFQGMSLIRYSMEYFRIPGILRILFYFILIMIPNSIGFFALMAFGVLDFWADFRKKTLKLGEVK